MTGPPHDLTNPYAVARWAAEVALDDPERSALWLQRAGGGVAWLRTEGELPRGSSASGCVKVATVDANKAWEILRSEAPHERWLALTRLAGKLREALGPLATG